MPTREQLLPLVRDGISYQEIGARFAIPAGQAYMIVTGLPADGSDVLAPEDLQGRFGLLSGGSQHLANPSTQVPTEDEDVLEWIGQRAEADWRMQQAAVLRTAEPSAPAEAAEDVVDVLGQQHNQIKYLQEQVEAIQKDTDRHKQAVISILDMMRIRLSQHESAEEAHFWPAVRKSVPDGESLADEALQQEQRGKDLLQELDGMSGDDERFTELLEELSTALRKHVAFEDYVFLKAKDAIPEEKRKDLGRRIEKASEHGPTRPHPHAPADSKATATAAATAAAPLDHARDTAGKRPARRKGKAEGEESSAEKGNE